MVSQKLAIDPRLVENLLRREVCDVTCDLGVRFVAKPLPCKHVVTRVHDDGIYLCA